MYIKNPHFYQDKTVSKPHFYQRTFAHFNISYYLCTQKGITHVQKKDRSEGARAKDFELAIQWLIECGLLTCIHRVKEPRLPLIAYQELATFKLFLLDVGLLAAMSGIDQRTLLRGNNIFTEFKGALTEQYVMQQFHALDLDYIGYWTNERSTAEVDFLLQTQGEVIPVEVKAEENLRAKSFKVFCENYTPSRAIRTSMRPYKEEPWMTNIPLYAIAHY